MGINTYIFFYNFVIYIIFCGNRSIECCSLVVVLHAFYMEGAGSTPIYHHLAIFTTIFVKMWDLNFYFASINFFYQHGPPKNLLLAPPLDIIYIYIYILVLFFFYAKKETSKYMCFFYITTKYQVFYYTSTNAYIRQWI
jgi:hypothetical protein